MLDVTTLQIFTFRFSICSFPWRLGTVRFKFYAALSSELCTNPLPEIHIRVETFRMDRMADSRNPWITSRRTSRLIPGYRLTLVLMTSLKFRHVVIGSFAFVFRAHT